jgi:predicted chitinase
MADDDFKWDDDPFGGDLDFDDDFDKPKKGFIRSFTTGFLSGIVSKSVGDTDAKINTLKMALPNTWLSAFSNVQQLNDRRKEVMEEIKGDSYQTVQDLQYLAKRGADKLAKGTPNKISDGLYKFSEHDFSDWEKRDYSSGPDAPSMGGDVSQEEVAAQLQNEDANSLLERDTMTMVADRTIGMMNEIGGRQIAGIGAISRTVVRSNQLLEQLLDHQRRVQARTDAMHLNVATRTYLTQAKYFKFQEAAQHRLIAELKDISKFSKMSDYEKTSHSQAVRKALRDEVFSTVKSKFGGISDFINERFGKDAREGAVGGIADVASSLRMASEMTEGAPINMGDMLGNAAAGIFLNNLPRMFKSNKGQEYLGKFKKQFPAFAKWAEDAYKRLEDLGNVASYATGNAEGLANSLSEFYNGGFEYNEVVDYDEYLATLPAGKKPISKIEWNILKTLKSTANKGLGHVYSNTWNSSGSRYSLEGRTLEDMHEQQLWTRRSDRTLNEILPQWLSQIHLSIEKFRTGDDGMKAWSYDYTRSRFNTHQQKVARATNLVLDHNQFAPAAQAANNLADSIAGNSGLSPEAKKVLSLQLIKDADQNKAFVPYRFMNLDEKGITSPKIAAEIRRAMKAEFDITDDHITQFRDGTDLDRIGMAGMLPTEKARAKVVGVADANRSLGNIVPDMTKRMDLLKSNGSYDALKEAGLITTDEFGRDDVNMDLFWNTMSNFIANPEYRPAIVEEDLVPLRSRAFGGNHNPSLSPITDPKRASDDSQVGPDGIKVQGMDKLTESLGSIGDLKAAIAGLGQNHPMNQAMDMAPLSKGVSDLNERVAELITLAGTRNDILTRMLNNQPGKRESSQEEKEVNATKRGIIDRLRETNFKDMFNNGVDKLLDHEPLILGGLLGGLATMAFHNPKAAALIGGGAAAALAYGKIRSMANARAAEDSEDLYEEGSDQPILEAWKLQRKDYYDATKSTIITSWKEISGSVWDNATKVFIGARRLAAKLFTKENKEVFLNGLSKVRDLAIKAFKFIDPFGRAIALKNKLVTRFYQMDVYKEGDESPILAGTKFALGEYWKRGEDGYAVQINGWNEIDGPVYDKDGQVLITQEDYDRGLKTSMGVSVNKLGEASRRFGKLSMDFMAKVKAKAAPHMAGAKDRVAGAFKADYSPIVNSVDRIYHLLLKHWGYAHEELAPPPPVESAAATAPVAPVTPSAVTPPVEATVASAPVPKPVAASKPTPPLVFRPKGLPTPPPEASAPTVVAPVVPPMPVTPPNEVPPEEIARREEEDRGFKNGPGTFREFSKLADQRAAGMGKGEGHEGLRLNSAADLALQAKEALATKRDESIINIAGALGAGGPGKEAKKKAGMGLFGLIGSGIAAITGGLFSVTSFLTKFFAKSWWKSLGRFSTIGIRTLPMIATGITAVAKGIFTLLKTRSLGEGMGDFTDTLRKKKRTKEEKAARSAERKTPGGRVMRGGKWLGAGMAVGMATDALASSGVIDEGGAIDKVAGFAGDAATAYGAYQTAAAVAGVVGVDLGAAAVTGAGMAWGGLTAGAGMLAPLLFNPYTLAALGIAAAGYGIYRYVTRGSGKQYEIRMAQYGISDPDSDLAKKVLQIEEMLTDHVVIGNARASLSKSAPLDKVLQMFVTEPGNKKQMGDIYSWFNGRFKPVFLTYMACLDVVKIKNLKDYDDAKTQDVLKVAKQTHQTLAGVMPYPYSIVAKIDIDTPIMGEKITVVKVNNLLEELRAYIDRKTEGEDKGTVVTAMGAGALQAEKAKLEAQLADPRKAFADEKDPGGARLEAKKRLAAIDGQLQQLNTTYKVAPAVAQVFIKDMLPDDRPVDLLTGIRLACYGNDQDLLWRVEAVLKLERYCESLFVISGDKIEFKGLVGDIFGLFKESFRLDKGDADDWCLWFRDRFIPVMSSYISAMQAYRKGLPGAVWKTLSVTARYEIARKLIETQVEISGWFSNTSTSIWNVRASPFKDGTSPDKSAKVERMLNLLGEASVTAKMKDPEGEAGKTSTQAWANTISPHKTGGGFTEKQANTQTADQAKSTRDVALGGMYGTNTTRGAGTGNTYNQLGAYQTPENKYGYKPLTGSSDTSHLDLSGVRPADGGDDHGVKVPKNLAEQLIIREMLKQGFTDPRAIAEMLALTNYETGGFSRTVENMKYTSPENLVKTFREVTNVDQARQLIQAGEVAIANTVYGGGKGQSLGNKAPGDGWKYRGRGFVQLTGREKYAKIGQELGIDLENKPELASNDPNVMAAIAVNFYKNSKLLQSITQSGDFGTAATGLNGGNQLPGMPKRFSLYTDYLKQLQSGSLKADEESAAGTNASASQTAGSMYGGGAPSTGGSSAGGGSAPMIGGNTPSMGAAPGGGLRNSSAYGTPPSMIAPGGNPDGGSYGGGGGEGTSLVGGGVGINNGGLRLKSSETIAGGPSHPAITRLASIIQSRVQNFKQFTALNDAYHRNKKPNSKHAVGLALDFTLTNGINGSDQAVGVVNEILRSAGMVPADFLIINEYRKASAGATGGHVHVGFKSKEAADKYAAAAGANQENGQDTLPGGTGAEPQAEAAPSGMPSAPPDTSTVATPEMIKAAAENAKQPLVNGNAVASIDGYTGLPLPNGGAPRAPQQQPMPEGYGKSPGAPKTYDQVTQPNQTPLPLPGPSYKESPVVEQQPVGEAVAAVMQPLGEQQNALLKAIHEQLLQINSNGKPTGPSVTV